MATREIDELVPAALREKIRAAATADPKFQAAFLEAPQTAYRAKFGHDLLPGEVVEVKALEDDTVLFFLPRIQQGIVVKHSRRTGDELSDEELEIAVGGAYSTHQCARAQITTYGA